MNDRVRAFSVPTLAQLFCVGQKISSRDNLVPKMQRSSGWGPGLLLTDKESGLVLRVSFTSSWKPGDEFILVVFGDPHHGETGGHQVVFD